MRNIFWNLTITITNFKKRPSNWKDRRFFYNKTLNQKWKQPVSIESQKTGSV